MRAFLIVVASVLVSALSPVLAQPYPNKPVRIVVPYPPGGGGDLHARVIAQKLSPLLGQTVLVENKAGASGNIGSDYVAKAAPDGYTLLLATSNNAIAPAFSTKLTYDVLKDFAPITTTQFSQQLLVVRPSLPVKDLRALIAHARANPGKLTFGTAGVGMPLLAVELMKSMAGLDMLAVPYKGDSPALTDLIGERIDVYAGNLGAVTPFYKTGKVRGLAVTSKKRAASLPEVPTIDQAGIPGYDLQSWMGIVAPAGTPGPIVDQLNVALVKVVAMPEVQKQLADQGALAASSTPDEFQQLIKDYVERFTRLVKSAGLKVE
jgi:tripartite-type tricarboxylate transporter receptor subunit TctC